MNDYSPHQDYLSPGVAAVDRPAFIRQTYLHVAGAVGAFVLLEAMLLASPLAPVLAQLMFGGKFSWLIVLGLFMFVSHIATKWASTATSIGGQYAGLGLYIVAEVIILCPLLLIASTVSEGIIPKAALITGGVFIGLTWIAFTSGKDFSFLGGFLKIAFFVALATIVVGMLFGFNLGLWFTGAMLLLMGGTILYQTSNVIHHYHTSQYVAASLALFASIATLFWYVIQLLLSLSSRD
jgi:FtsH-binding integral membrane protein